MRIILTRKTKEKLQKKLKRAQALNNLRLYKMVLCILLVHKQYTRILLVVNVQISRKGKEVKAE